MSSTFRNRIKKKQLKIYRRRLDYANVTREALIRQYGYLPDWDLTAEINERTEKDEEIIRLYQEIDKLVGKRLKQLRNMSVDNF